MDRFLFLSIVLFQLAICTDFTSNSMSLNGFIKTTKLFCVQDLHQTVRKAFFQNKISKNVHMTVDGIITVIQPVVPQLTYKKLECIGNSRISLLASNNSIYLYDEESNQISSFNGYQVEDMTYVKSSLGIQRIVYLSGTTLRIKNISFLSSEQTYELNSTYTKIVCSTYRNLSLDGYCFMISSDRTKIRYFNVQNPGKMTDKTTDSFQSLKISEMNQKIYVGFDSGFIKQYSLRNGVMYFQLLTKVSQAYGIIDIAVNQPRNELIYLNSQLKAGIISLSTGYEIGHSMSCNTTCTSTSKILLVNTEAFAFLSPSLSNTFQMIMVNDAVISSSLPSTTNPFSEMCTSDQMYFNTTLQGCLSCDAGCSFCDQQTSTCFECKVGYFFEQDTCLNCKYASLTESSYNLCFSQSQVNVLTITNAVAPILTTGIQCTYSILSGSALLFIFIRFINFWSIVSLYYFLNIEEVPYFLLEFLQKIFTILYGSVFEYFGIDLGFINMGIDNEGVSQKMKLTKISTDFLASNFQSIVTYLYSLVMICVVYDAIKRWFKNMNIHIFQKVKLEACLEQFIGIFITLIVPLTYFLKNMSSIDAINKLNKALFILFLGIGLNFPFIYLILIVKRVTLKERLNMIKKQIQIERRTSQNELHNEEKLTTKSQQKQTKNSKKRAKFCIKKSNGHKKEPLIFSMDFVSEQETQKFLYCLNALWSPFLVGYQWTGCFLLFGLAINFLSVWNAFYAKHWRANIILQKFILLTYHLCYVVIALFPKTYFSASLFAIILIIFGGIQELLTSVIQKFYFLYLVLKHKKIIRDNKISQQLSKSQKRVIGIYQYDLKSQVEKSNIFQINYQNFQRSTLKDVDLNSISNIQQKIIVKKPNFIEGNHPILKSHHLRRVQNILYWNQETSMQQINFLSGKNLNHANKKVKFFCLQNSQSQTKQPASQNVSQNKSQIQQQNQANYQTQKLDGERKSQFDEDFQQVKENTKLKLKTKQTFSPKHQKLIKKTQDQFSKSLNLVQSKSLKSLNFLKVVNSKSIKKIMIDSNVQSQTFYSEVNNVFSHTN